MAIDKAVDSTELDNGLTTVANAIRSKGGTSEQLSFPDGMAEAIAAIPSGGGIDVKSATRCEIITIGANTVSNPIEALEFFGYTAPYDGIAIVLLDTPTTQNQFGFSVIKKGTTSSGVNSTPWWRWRDNAVVWPNTFSTAWDAKLVENSKYLVIEW